ncbi:hypothetical protein FRC19_011948 [Serendipita sp. 401]|nr:hypothetical protein FRC19_011948 [Serendipita sp. 401]KAG9020534.1 hypothetical protein FS842_007219 [Serendipita sp. 407]
MVDEKSSSSSSDEGSGDATMKTLLDHLITVSDDIELIQDELINILIAGRDTTASCITFATYMLSQHPSVSARLEREVLSVLGPSRAPTLDDFRSMPYLRAVINETLRLFPSVPLNVRDSLAERVWTDSTTGQRWYVPSGTSITYSFFHLHRSSRLWGPTCQQFDPARFLEEDERYLKYFGTSPFVFVPFNAGPRSCLGQQLAYAEVEVFLCRLMQKLAARGERIGLDEEAIPVEARVPAVWSQEGNPPESVCGGGGGGGKRTCAVMASVMRRFSSSSLDQEGISGGRGENLEGKVEEGVALPLHSSSSLSRSSTLSSSGSSSSFGSLVSSLDGRMIPATTIEGVSPRRAVERIRPKSHLTMYVDGGLWVKTLRTLA